MTDKSNRALENCKHYWRRMGDEQLCEDCGISWDDFQDSLNFGDQLLEFIGSAPEKAFREIERAITTSHNGKPYSETIYPKLADIVRKALSTPQTIPCVDGKWQVEGIECDDFAEFTTVIKGPLVGEAMAKLHNKPESSVKDLVDAVVEYLVEHRVSFNPRSEPQAALDVGKILSSLRDDVLAKMSELDDCRVDYVASAVRDIFDESETVLKSTGRL